MKSLLFEHEEMEIGPEARSNQDKIDVLVSMISKNITNSEKLIRELDECIFLDMPFTSKGLFSCSSGLVLRTLEVTDHAIALNQAWGLNCDERDIFIYSLFRALPHGGFGDSAPKYIKSVKPSVRGASVKWSKSPYYDYIQNSAKTLEKLVEIGFTSSIYLIPVLMNVAKNSASFCVITAENYIDNHLEKK